VNSHKHRWTSNNKNQMLVGAGYIHRIVELKSLRGRSSIWICIWIGSGRSLSIPFHMVLAFTCQFSLDFVFFRSWNRLHSLFITINLHGVVHGVR